MGKSSALSVERHVSLANAALRETEDHFSSFPVTISERILLPHGICAVGDTKLSYSAEMSMDLDLDFFGQDLGFFAGFGSDLDLRSWQVPDLDLQIFLTTLLIC